MCGGLWDFRSSVWDYLESTWTLASDLVGYVVEVADGRAGRVVSASSSSSAAYLVVDPAPSGGGLRLVPASVVTSLRHDERTVSIDVTRAQLAAAPAYGDHRVDDAVRAEHDHYFRALFGR